jgi:ABC-type lipoprotein export system ATPase subunit
VALHGTTLKVSRGELLCVLGPSGAGKSTLLRLIAGVQIPSAGAVTLQGAVDEPASRLDRANAAHVAELLVAAASEDGQTVLCATHDEDVIRREHEALSIGGWSPTRSRPPRGARW